MTGPVPAGDERLEVAEIFVSIQGESTFAGWPCTFVRLARCNLRCRWCDTPEARQPGTFMTRREVLERVLAGGTDLVEVTGGEPLLQRATLPLLAELCDAGHTVLLETNGSVDPSAVDRRVHRIVDVKPPSSGCAESVRLSVLQGLTGRDEIKFVLADRGDYEWMREMLASGVLPRSPTVLASCVADELELRRLARWVLADRLRVRLQVQLHKIIWGPAARGV